MVHSAVMLQSLSSGAHRWHDNVCIVVIQHEQQKKTLRLSLHKRIMPRRIRHHIHHQARVWT